MGVPVTVTLSEKVTSMEIEFPMIFVPSGVEEVTSEMVGAIVSPPAVVEALDDFFLQLTNKMRQRQTRNKRIERGTVYPLQAFKR